MSLSAFLGITSLPTVMSLKFKTVVKNAALRSLLLPTGAFLLLSVVGLSSSSGADEPLFVRSAQQLERLWSGVLGCTHPEKDDTRPTFEATLENIGAPSATDHDYAECGKRALRNTSSRMLVDTIEDAVRSGGVALFDKDFRLESNIGWAWGENVTGEFDAVVPLPSSLLRSLPGWERAEEDGQALFLQPGLVIWSGIGGESRTDSNFGLVYRRQFAPDAIVGGSVFYDYDFERGNRRLGLGAELQSDVFQADSKSGVLHAALNYYHPLNEWREGRTDYEERPLQGGDLRLGIAWSRVQLDARGGVWRLKREDDVRAQWRPSFGVDGGIRILPGVFLEAGYERHDEDGSLGSRWNTGLAFRFSLPGLEGETGSKRVPKTNLWQLVEREKRVLYEEREAVSRIQLVSRASTVLGGTSFVEEDSTMTIGAELARLAVPVMLELVIDEDDSTANLGADFSYGHKVYELDADTGQQSAPAAATDCPDATCEMMIPAGVTKFDVDLNILDDSEDKELPEQIVLRVDVPAEYQHMIRGTETTVTIRAHGNTVGFAPNSATELIEDEGTAEVTVEIDKPSPTPIMLSVTAGGEAILNTDYTLSTTRMRIPANAGSASLTLTGIDNDANEGQKSIVLTLSGDLPDGWAFSNNPDPEQHTVTFLDDDLAIGFTASNPTLVEESDIGSVNLTVAPNRTLPGAAVIAWSVTTGGADLGGSTSGSLSFGSGDGRNNPRTIALNVNDDSDAEDAEQVTVTLSDTSLPPGWNLGRAAHTFTIKPSDGVVTFTSTDAIAASEGDTLDIGITSTAEGPSEGYPLTVSFSPSASGDISFPSSVVLPAGRKSESFSITIEEDNTGEEAETFTMSLGSGVSTSDWTISSTRTVTINPNDIVVSFASPTATAREGGRVVDTLLSVTPPPTANSKVPFTLGGDGKISTHYNLMLTNASGQGSASFANNQFDYRANETGVNVGVLATEDNDNIVNETVIITIDESKLPPGWRVGAHGVLTVTLEDNEVPGEVGIVTGDTGKTSVSAREEEGVVAFTVGFSPALPAEAKVQFSVSGSYGDALFNFEVQRPVGASFAGDPRILTVPAGTTEVYFEGLILNDDNTQPGDIVVTIEDVSAPPGWTVGSPFTHTIRVEDDDTPPTSGTFQFAASSGNVNRTTASEGDTIELTVMSSVATDVDVPVRWTVTTGGSEVTDPDSGDVTIPSGRNSATFSIVITDDDDVDPPETVTVTLSDAVNNSDSWTPIGRTTHTINVATSDNIVSLGKPSNAEISEGGQASNVSVNIADTPLSASANVRIDFSGTASDGDFTVAATSPASFTAGTRGGVLTVPANQTGTRLSVTATGDDNAELDETLTLTLNGTHTDTTFQSGNWDVVSGSGASQDITIAANDNTIGFASSSEDSLDESDTADTATVTIEIEQQLQTPSSVLVVLAQDSEAESSDYSITGTGYVPGTGGTGTLTLPANTSSVELTVAVVDDGDMEGEEELVLTLRERPNPNGFPEGWEPRTGSLTHTITIADDDGPTPVGFSTSSSSAEEGASGHEIAFAINHSVTPLPDFDITVTATGDIGAADITASNTASVGGATTSWSIDIHDNSIVGDDDRTIEFTIEPVGLPQEFQVDTARNTHTLTITDDNDTGTVQFEIASSSASEPTDDHTVRLDVSALPASSFDLVINGSGGGEGASFGPSGDANAASSVSIDSNNAVEGKINVSILVDIIDDETEEQAETITLTIPGDNNGLPEGFSLGDQKTHTITIPANDRPVGKNTIGFATSSAIDLTEDGPAQSAALQLRMPDGTAFTGSTPAIPLAVTFGGHRNDEDFTVGFSTSAHGSFTSSPNLLSIAAGQTHSDGEISLSITPQGDSVAELREEYTVIIAPHTTDFPSDDWEVDTDAHQLTVRIAANENTVTFGTPSKSTITENGDFADIGVTIARPLPAGAVADIVITPRGVADPDSDYRLSVTGGILNGNTWRLPTGAGSATLTVTSVWDNDSEGAGEDLELVIGADGTLMPTGWTATTAIRTITIEDDDKNTIGFASSSPIELTEDGSAQSVALQLRMPGNAPFAGSTPAIPLAVTFGGDANDEDFTIDFSTPAHGSFTSSPNLFSIAAGQIHSDGEILLSITPLGDSVAELREEYTVIIAPYTTGFPSDDWEVDTSAHQITVRTAASDNTITFGTPSKPIITENGDFADIGVTIARPLPAGAVADIVITSRGVADLDSDYGLSVTGGTLNGNTWRLPTGAGSATLRVTSIRDDDSEGAGEDLELVIGAAGTVTPSGWAATAAIHTITIEEDAKNTIGFASSTPIELTEDGSAQSATLQLRMPGNAPFVDSTPTIPLAVTFGGDANDEDFTIGFTTSAHGSFTSSPDLLSIAAGQTHSDGEISLRIAPQGDSVAELQEEYTVTIAPHTTGFPSDDWEVDTNARQLTVRIAANDNSVTFGAPSSARISEEEGTSIITATVNRPLPADEAVTINVAGSGAPDKDYTISGTGYLSGVWTLPTGERNPTLTIKAVSNTDDDSERILSLGFTEVSSPDGWGVTGVTHTITIEDNDDPASASKNKIGFAETEMQLAEGDSVTLEGLLTDPNGTVLGTSGSDDLTINITPSGDIAAVNFTATEHTIPADTTLASGKTTLDSFNTTDDNAPTSGGVKRVTITMTAGTGFPSSDWAVDSTRSSIELVIMDDDEPTPVGFSSSSSSVAEGASGHEIVFAINHPVTPLPDFDVTVAATGDIEATDITASNKVPVGGTTTSWTIENIPNNSIVGDITVNLTIQPTGLPGEFQVDAAKNTHTLTITDDNDTGIVQFESEGSSASEPTDDHIVRLDISAPPASPFDLVIEAAEGEGASFGPEGDANATFPVRIDFDDAEDGKVNILVDVNDDEDREEDETITLTIPSEGHGLPEGFSLGTQATHTITILKNDQPDGKNTVRFASSGPVNLTEDGSAKSVGLQLRKPDGAAFTGFTPAIPLAVTFGGDSNNNDFNISFASATHGRFVSAPDLLFIAAAQTHLGGAILLNIIPRKDNQNELREEYTVTIEPHTAGFPDGWEVDADANQLNIRIAANENTITFGEPSHSNISEEGGTSTITAAINRPIPVGETAIINIAESGASTGDYIMTGAGYSDGVWTLPAGELTPSLTIKAVSNLSIDDDRTLELAFTRATLPQGWSVTAATHTIIIEDNDEPTLVGFSESSSSVAENASGHTIAFDINYPVALPDFNIMVTATGDIEAADVTASNAVSVGGATTNWTIKNIPDNSIVGDRTIEFTMQPTGLPKEFQVDTAKSTHTLTITDNDDTGTVQFESAASSASEPTDDHTVRLDISAPPASPFDLVIEATGGSENASFGPEGDANATFPVRIDFDNAEDGKVDIVVDINDDNEQEEVETIILTIPSTGHGLPEGFSLGERATHTITIPANDQPADKNTIGFASPATIDLTEDGPAKSTALQLRTIDSAPFANSTPAIPLAVTFGGDRNDEDFTIGFTTSAHGSFTSSPGLLSIAAGQTHSDGEISLSIAPQGDSVAELQEEYTVTIAPHTENFPDGWEVDTDANRLTIRIAANDNVVTFAEPMPDSIVENGGAATVVVTINQELPAEETSATVTVTPTNDNLTRDTDYSLSVSGGELSGNTWTLPTQETNPVLTITALSDIESDEILTLDFAGATLPDGWTASAVTHTVTIDDISVSSIIGFAKAAGTFNEPPTDPGGSVGTAHNVKLQLPEAPPEDFVVHFEFTGEADRTSSTGDYSATESHTIRVADIDDNLMVDYPFSILADDTAERDETFTIAFAAKQPDLPEKWGINAGNNTYTVTIPANDNIIEFASAGPSTILERTDRVTHSVILTVNINRPLPTAAKINIAIDEESTTQSDDYEITGSNYSDGVLTLPANANNVRFVVTAIDDHVDDNDESFILELSELADPDGLPSGWIFGEQTSYTINITDNNRGVTFASDNSVEFTEGEGTIELFLGADDGGVALGWAETGRARLLDGEGNHLPSDGSSTGVRFPVSPGGQHLTTIHTVFPYRLGEYVREVVSTSNYSSTFLSGAQDLNNGKPYTLFIGEDDNFTDDVFIYEIYRGVLSLRRSWGSVQLPLRWKFTVKDNDIGGFIEFAESESSISEAPADNSTDITIYLRKPLPSETKVALSFGGTATSADYTVTGDTYDSSSNILTFPANEDKVILTVTADDDEAFTPGGKTVTLDLAALTGADALPDGWSVRSGASRHTVAITDDESLIEFVSADSMIVEVDPAGSSATDGVATVSLTLPPLSNDLKLNVAIAGSATLTDDYTITAPGYESGVLTIPAMDTSVDFTVTAVDDTLSDSAETVVLTLSERTVPDAFPTGVNFGDLFSHTVTITDDESKVGITQARKDGTLNEPSTGQNWRITVPVGALGTDSADALAEVMTEDVILEVSL